MSDYEYYECECGRWHGIGIECAIGKKARIKIKKPMSDDLKQLADDLLSPLKCPKCGKELVKITWHPFNSVLNEYQFEAVKAGDYYCERCPASNHPNGNSYFWEKDL